MSAYETLISVKPLCTGKRALQLLLPDKEATGAIGPAMAREFMVITRCIQAHALAGREHRAEQQDDWLCRCSRREIPARKESNAPNRQAGQVRPRATAWLTFQTLSAPLHESRANRVVSRRPSSFRATRSASASGRCCQNLPSVARVHRSAHLQREHWPWPSLAPACAESY